MYLICFFYLFNTDYKAKNLEKVKTRDDYEKEIAALKQKNLDIHRDKAKMVDTMLQLTDYLKEAERRFVLY